jgi:hypothetical protein
LAYIKESKVIIEDEDEENLPDEVDWCAKGVVSPIVDQQELDIYWAISAVGVVKSLIPKTTGSLVRLLVQEMVDCIGGDCNVDEGYIKEHDISLYMKDMNCIRLSTGSDLVCEYGSREN